MTTVRLLTYNILGARARVALRSVITSVEPDVLLVNDSPKIPLLWRWQAPSLARQWELQHVAGGRNAGRNMICAQPHIGVAHTHLQRIRKAGIAPIGGVVSAQLQAGSHRFGVVGCHLGIDPAARVGQVEEVLRAADELEGPVVVAGDLNEPPTAPAWEALLDAGFVDHGDEEDYTFPAEKPRQRLDALLVRGDVHVQQHTVPAVQSELLRLASDHLPVTATLAWPH